MKFSVAFTLLILAVGGAMALTRQGKLTALRDDHRKLATRAAELGISTETHGDPRITKRQRDERKNQTRSTVAALVSFARDMELNQKNGGKPDEAYEKRSREMMNLLMELDAAGIKGIIAGLREDGNLSDETRRNIIGFSIMMLGDDHPASALALYSQSSDLLGASMMGRHVINSSVSRWAKEDPAAALAWVRKNSAEHPEISHEDLEQSVIAGAGEKNPALAFKLIGETHADPSPVIRSLVESAKTPEQRTALLDALRGHLATLPAGGERDDMLGESLENMGRNLTNENFDSVKGWISSAKLSPAETAQFAAGLSYFNTKEDTGRWIDWMAQNLPKDAVDENVDNLIGQWTQQDYLAAGKWLSASPDGLAKSAAVATYAETVAEYEPQTAVQWALTLPAGDRRRSTLEAIYRNWPEKDAAAGEAFAREHGIDPESAREEP